MKAKVKRVLVSSAYAIMVLLFPVVTIILVAIAQGYRFNFQTGQVITSGLALAESKPSGARILVDGEDIGETTKERLIFPVGDHDLELRLDRYRPWRKRVPFQSSQVTAVQYPVLVLESPVSTNHLSLPKLTQFSGSHDKKFIALVSQNQSELKVQVFEPAKNGELRTIFMPTTDQHSKGVTVTKLVWAQDSEHLLVELKVGDQPQQVIVDAVGDDQLINLTELFQLPLNDLKFDPKNWRELFWLSPQGLRRVDVAARTVSGVLAAGVVDYTVEEAGVFFIQHESSTASLVSLGRDNQIKIIISGLNPTVAHKQLKYLDFDSEEHLAFINPSDRSVHLYTDIHADPVITRTFDVMAQQLYVSPTSRYLLMRDGARFVTYDLDKKRLHRFQLPYQTISHLSWYDEHHVLVVADGEVVLFEFDGGNIESITPANSDFPAWSEKNGKRLWSVSRPGADGSLLVQTSKIIE